MRLRGLHNPYTARNCRAIHVHVRITYPLGWGGGGGGGGGGGMRMCSHCLVATVEESCREPVNTMYSYRKQITPFASTQFGVPQTELSARNRSAAVSMNPNMSLPPSTSRQQTVRVCTPPGKCCSPFQREIYHLSNSLTTGYMRILTPVYLVLHNLAVCLHERLSVKWCLPEQHLVEADPQRPPVTLWTIHTLPVLHRLCEEERRK